MTAATGSALLPPRVDGSRCERFLSGPRCGCCKTQRQHENAQRAARNALMTSAGYFLCSRCRVQVLVCRRCDRGQIYCFGACAQEARRERRREPWRRYQATDRGWAMHAERNRRYRARWRCVTDHGPLVTRSERRLPTVNTASSDPPRGSAPCLGLCHRCSRSASPLVRLSALPRRHVGRRRRRFGHPP